MTTNDLDLSSSNATNNFTARVVCWREDRICIPLGRYYPRDLRLESGGRWKLLGAEQRRDSVFLGVGLRIEIGDLFFRDRSNGCRVWEEDLLATLGPALTTSLAMFCSVEATISNYGTVGLGTISGWMRPHGDEEEDRKEVDCETYESHFSPLVQAIVLSGDDHFEVRGPESDAFVFRTREEIHTEGEAFVPITMRVYGHPLTENQISG